MSSNISITLNNKKSGRKVSPENIAAIKALPLATVSKDTNGNQVVAAQAEEGKQAAIHCSYTNRTSFKRAAKEADEEIKFVKDRNDDKKLFIFRVAKGTNPIRKVRVSSNSALPTSQPQ